MATVALNIPNTATPHLPKVSSRSTRATREPHREFNETTLQAISDVRSGRTFKASSLADLMAQLND